jgi:drug/metabolite transporter (DMT)-like permease
VSVAWRVRLALAVTVLMWASAFVAIRVGARDYAPGPFLLLRFLIPAVLLGALAARTGDLLPKRRDRGRAVVLGLLFVSYIGLLVLGEATVDAGTASMLAETSPLMTAALAALLLGERVGGWLIAGLVAGFGGAALIALAGEGGVRLETGALAILGAALAQAALIVLQRPMLERQSAIAVVAQASVVGAVVTLPFAGRLVDGVRDAPASATLAIVFVAITTGAVSYVTFAYALARSTSAGRASAVLYLVQPATIRGCAKSIAMPPSAAAPTPTPWSTAITCSSPGSSRPTGPSRRRSVTSRSKHAPAWSSYSRCWPSSDWTSPTSSGWGCS